MTLNYRHSSVRFVSSVFDHLITAIDINKDWHTDEELLNGLRRIDRACTLRQLRRDRADLMDMRNSENIPFKWFSYTSHDQGLNTDSVATLLLFRLLTQTRSRKQAILNINYYRPILEDFINDYFRITNPERNRSQQDSEQITVEATTI